ncbi:MAG: ABC transporter permease [Verrucomicrobiales bacterium]|nr:ABC transporter permease [Verrucomicrobiales bacterium]
MNGSAPKLPSQNQPGFNWSRLKRTVRLGWKSLWLHRLRSLLTALGIVFGVCSVIAMLAIGEGASHEAQEQIKNLGSQNIILRSEKPPEEQKVSNTGQSYVLEYGLTYEDVQAIQNTIPGVTVIVPARVMSDFVWNITRRTESEILGTVPWYPGMRNLRVVRGRFFTEQEMEESSNVCVLGAEVAEKLFPLEPPVGGNVRVGSTYYRVIGVMEARARTDSAVDSSAIGASSGLANRMFIPLTTARTRYGEILRKRRTGSFEQERVALHEVTVKVADRDEVINVSQAIQALLERRHKKTDYTITVPLKLLRSAERTKQIFNIVLGSIAAISLLVGGIGIMNIMLASVTERTREIGIRRALGAKRRDIITQFLVETVMLSGAGGLIGVFLGISIPYVVTYFADMVTIVTFWSPMIAFTISALVGVVFGIYPAMRAADMDPVEALRHE